VDGRLDEAKAEAKRVVEWFMDDLKADDLVICLSDDVQNFRKRIDPTYKQLRTATERPVHLYDLKEWMGEKWSSRLIATFEADDVMGIMSTEPHTGERVIVSNDKDMKTIPGLLCRPDYERRKLNVVEITEEAADRFHLWQTLTGDTCDGYDGCPGVGGERAEPILDGYGFQRYDHTITKGKRKGEIDVRWPRFQFDGPWPAIVSAYEKAGLTEADAIRQARLAFILRSSHYVDGRRLDWNPPK
jgi:DNA polymerase-1